MDELDVTDYPVEEGSDNTDHVRKLPASIEINGVVTNTPLVYLASLQAPSPVSTDHQKNSDRVEVAYKHLRKMQDDGELVDVVSSLREYKNMVIKTITVFRDSVSGNILGSTIGLRELTIAGTLTVDLPLPDDAANKAAKNKGKNEKTNATEKQSESSLSKIRNAATGG